MVNAYATGNYLPTWDGQQNQAVPFTGMALWSGTSFATPLVAGMVATRMTTAGQSSRQAWESLFQTAVQQTVFPALHPGQGLP